MIPSLGPWETIHPLVVHFPIALLLTAPMLMLIALIIESFRKVFALAAFVVVVCGTVGAFVAVNTGEAAEELAEAQLSGNTQGMEVFERHEELGETTRNVFAVLAVVYGAVIVATVALKRTFTPLREAGLHLIFLLVYLGCTLLVINTGHLGGRLVHEFGVRANVNAAPQGPAPSPPAPLPGPEEREAEDVQ